MAGYNTILTIRRLEEECSKLGFMMCHSKHGHGSRDFGDVVALKPKDADSLPIYARDAELFCGSLEELDRWLQGVSWARKYDQMLRLSNDTKRKRKEQDERNRALLSTLAKMN
jgi:hypothetical protein